MRTHRSHAKLPSAVYNQQRWSDFFLTDGRTSVFINGARPGLCKVDGHTDIGGRTDFSIPPPGIAMIIGQDIIGHMWTGRHDITGRFRYSQRSFDVNEAVACLGVVAPGATPDGQPCKIMQPATSGALPESFFKDHNWEEWDIDSWKELSRHGALLLSDDRKFTGSVSIAPLTQLPAFQTTPSNFAGAQQYMPQPQQQQMGGPQGYAPQQAPYRQPSAPQAYPQQQQQQPQYAPQQPMPYGQPVSYAQPQNPYAQVQYAAPPQQYGATSPLLQNAQYGSGY